MTRRVALVAVVLLSALPTLAAAQPAQPVRREGEARTIVFPAFTVDQNWNRAATVMHAYAVSGFAFAKSRGVDAETYGRTIGEMFAPGWGDRDGGSAIRYARGIQNNFRAIAGTSVDVLEVGDTLVTMRVTRSWRSFFGPTQAVVGVTLAEYDSVFAAITGQIAQYLGLRFAERVDTDYVTMTISGRGKNAVLDFPRGTYVWSLGAEDVPGHPEDVGTWESTYTPDGRFTVRKNGALFVQGDYELAFDEVVWRSERLANGEAVCTAPGRYRWTANAATGALSFGRLADDCDNRVLVLTRKPLAKR